jgi:hypothetical protein
MIYSTHKNFVDSSELKIIADQLTNTPGWVYRTNFWRYYLVSGLKPYSESDSDSWYSRQDIVPKLDQPWRTLFERVAALSRSRLLIQRYALTGQTQNQSQTLHYDTSQNLKGDFRSYLIYLNHKWNSTQGGETHFELSDGQSHQEFPEPGKLIEFNSQTLHKGNAPSVPNMLRLTMVIHGQLI